MERTFLYQRMTKFYLRDFDADFPGHRYDCYIPLELLEKTRASVAGSTYGGSGGEKEFVTDDEVQRFKKYFSIFDAEGRFLRLRDRL